MAESVVNASVSDTDVSLEREAVDDSSETSELESGWVLDPLLEMVSVAEESDTETELSIVVLGRLVVSGASESADVVIGDSVESVFDDSVLVSWDDEPEAVNESVFSKEDVDS
ncbi:hypothetical protein PG991_006118 [Apiospora marii]|uniref:Uncharacterized protein n=1 Tax=Apiospora marii TaxID=335849 RepID=A0ABR1SB44_9PEZI